MKGYHESPEATRESITEDGWMKTGDLAVIDAEGYCSVVGRLKDTIIRRGENIAPTEVEEALFAHPSVLNVAVVGVPDPKFAREQICACVVPRDEDLRMIDGDVDALEDVLREHCAPRLAHFKVPRYFRFVDGADIPMTVSGKVQKHILRELSVAALGL